VSGTTPSGITYPDLGDAPNINEIQTLASDLDPLVVGKFASAAARDAAYPSPADGQVIYRTDTNNIEAYNTATSHWDVFGAATSVKRVVGTAFVGSNYDGTSQIIEQSFQLVPTVTAANWSISYPQAFPNGVFSVNVSVQGTTTASQIYVTSFTLSGLVGQLWAKDGGVPPTQGYRLFVHAVGW
jgi:hypothetical protein